MALVHCNFMCAVRFVADHSIKDTLLGDGTSGHQKASNALLSKCTAYNLQIPVSHTSFSQILQALWLSTVHVLDRFNVFDGLGNNT